MAEQEEDPRAWLRSHRAARVRNLLHVTVALRSGRGQPIAEALSDALLEAMRAGNEEQLKYLVQMVADGRLREDSLAAAWRRARVQRLPLSRDMQRRAVDFMVKLRYGYGPFTTEELSRMLLRVNCVEGAEFLLRTVTNVQVQRDSLEAACGQARDQGVFLRNKIQKLLKRLLRGYSELLSREQPLGWDALWGLVDRLLDEYLPRLLDLLGRDGEEEDEAVELATLSALAIRELKGHFYRSYGEVPWEEFEYLLVTFVEARTVYKTLAFLVASRDRLRVHLEFFLEKVKNLRTTYISRLDREAAVEEMKKAPKGERAVVTAKASGDQPLKAIREDFALLRDWHSLDEVVEALEAAIAALRLPSQSWEEWGWLALRRGLFLAGEKMKNTWSSPNLSGRYTKLLELTAPEGILKLLCSGIRDVQEHPKVVAPGAPVSNAEALTMSDLDSEEWRREGLEEELGRVLHTVSAMLTEAESDLWAKKGKNLIDMAQSGRVNTSLRSNCVTSDTNVIYREVKKILEAANTGRNDEELEKIIRELRDLLRHKDRIDVFLKTPPQLNPLADHNNKVYKAVLQHCPQDFLRIIQLLEWKCAEGLSNFQADLNESSCIGGGSGEASRCAIERGLSALEAIDHDSNHEGPVRQYAIEGGLQALASRWYKDDRAPPLLVAHEPALFGRQLRNYLNHKDLAMTLLFPTRMECGSLWVLLLDSRSLVADRRDVAPRVQEPAAAAVVNAEVLRLARLKDDMFRGARRGDLAEVQRAAGLGVDISSRDCRGRTLLHAAAEAGRASLVGWLLKTKAVDPLALDWEGRSALHCAGTGEVAKLLLAAGRVAPCDYGCSPLHTAAFAGRADVILALIPHYDLNDKDGTPFTPLHLAARGGHEAAVRALLQAGARYESVKEGCTPLFLSATAGSAPVVSLLLDPSLLLPQPSHVDCWRAAGGAGYAGLQHHLDVFSTLTAELKRRSAQLDSAVAQWCVGGVAEGGSTEVADELLVHWPDAVRLELDIYNQKTALSIAAANGRAALVRTLLSRGADPLQRDKDSDTALHLAAHTGSVEVINALWDHTQAEQDAGRRAELGLLWEGRGEEDPPLCVAAGRGHLEALQRLVQLGADKDAGTRDEPDVTPLRRAATRGHAEVVRWLVKEGARLFDRSKPSFTPLMAAALRGHLAVVKLLVPASQLTKQQQRERLDLLQHVNPNGWTALHCAVPLGSLEVVRYILERELQLLELHYSRTVKDRRSVTPRNVTVYSVECTNKCTALQCCVRYDAPSSVFRELLRYMENTRLMELAGKDVTDVRDMVRAALDLVEPASRSWTALYGRGHPVQEMKKVLRESLRRLQDPVLSQAEESLRLLSL
ncbi:uncharacterized protein LOC113215718 [Frankliniella occidentalis]|uniref:Uncharacterized protein LOC113215718 n=1 Tax=Frankliniella occidentalis TaxID=133901 RepID=A0A6J1TC79_FRAOC|nr:uncharacterized protein LOC113215718 [Frankliniella occidentalis]XP_026291167.1 uncharacterized protein LOC113215718 [Frankliniella occidentalis]XP_026291169.1 uncharacterized protein LOC113215718 [Frankliniella occidentalis]XP_052125278.1 uncharacterized protein LOC113215718 [Frankliniella occidentalis]